MTNTLTVTEAVGQIPPLKIDNIAVELVGELADQLDIHMGDDLEAALKLIRESLLEAVTRALWVLEPVTIVADQEEDC